MGNANKDEWKSLDAAQRRAKVKAALRDDSPYAWHMKYAAEYTSMTYLRRRDVSPHMYDYFYGTDMPTSAHTPISKTMSGTVASFVSSGKTIVHLWDKDRPTGAHGVTGKRCSLFVLSTNAYGAGTQSWSAFEDNRFVSHIELRTGMGTLAACDASYIFSTALKYRGWEKYTEGLWGLWDLRKYVYGFTMPSGNQMADDKTELVKGPSVVWTVSASLSHVAISPLLELRRRWQTTVGMSQDVYSRGKEYIGNQNSACQSGENNKYNGWKHYNQDTMYVLAGFDSQKGVRAWQVDSSVFINHQEECTAAVDKGQIWSWYHNRALYSSEGQSDQRWLIMHEKKGVVKSAHVWPSACRTCDDTSCMYADKVGKVTLSKELSNNANLLKQCLETIGTPGRFWCWRSGSSYAVGTEGSSACDFQGSNNYLRYAVFVNGEYSDHKSCQSCYDTKCWHFPPTGHTTTTLHGTLVPVVKGYGNLPSTYCAIHQDGTGSCTLLFPDHIQFHGCAFMYFMGLHGDLSKSCTQGVLSMETAVVTRRVADATIQKADDTKFTTQDPFVRVCVTYVAGPTSQERRLHCLKKPLMTAADADGWFQHFVKIHQEVEAHKAKTAV